MRHNVKFWKDIKLIKFCKAALPNGKSCKVEYRPARYSFSAALGLCHTHRRVYYRDWYVNIYLPFFLKLSPERKKKYREMQDKRWKKWIIKYPDKRRRQALESYHRKKHLHKDRKHRASNILNK